MSHVTRSQAEVYMVLRNVREDTLPTEPDGRKQLPELLMEVRGLRVIRGSGDPTDEHVARHERVHLPSRSWCSIAGELNAAVLHLEQ